MSASLVSLESAFSVFMYFSSAIRTTYLTLLPDLSNRTCQNDTETKIVCLRRPGEPANGLPIPTHTFNLNGSTPGPAPSRIHAICMKLP